MKAERRHELQTNTLAQFLNELPILLRIHANKLLMGVIVICAIVLLVRYRMNASAQAREDARAALDSARRGIDQFARIEAIPDPGERVKQRLKLSQQIQTAVEQLLAATSDPDDAPVRAEAYIAQGDLYWAMANLAVVPGAATQPALAMPETAPQYLTRAEMAYQRVLKDYASQPVAKATAQLALAAVEENRREWDKAIEFYNQVITDAQAADVFKAIARQRLAMIPQLRSPVYLGEFSSTQPTTVPTTEPASSETLAPTTTASPSTNPQ
jgi:tetratricopeptide (TPR) repeat protein